MVFSVIVAALWCVYMDWKYPAITGDQIIMLYIAFLLTVNSIFRKDRE